MRIQIINPNTTAAFTRRLGEAVAKVAAPGTTVVAVNPPSGPATVESHAEEALAALGVMRLVQDRDADAHVVACFGDTGVHAARELARGPVIGMTEAALYAAAMVAARFAIVTLPRRTRAHAERVLQETGLAHRCSVRAVDVNVGELENEADAVLPVFRVEARRAIEQDGSEALILGCAGLSELVEPLTRDLGIPVIDGVLVGVKFAEALVATGLTTSRLSTYAPLGGSFRLP